MSKTADLVRARLSAYLEPHGAVSDFSRKTGIPRKNLDNWMSGTAIPTDAIDAIAAGMGLSPWQLLKPEGAAEPSPAQSEGALFREILIRLGAADHAQLEAILALLDGLSPKSEAHVRRRQKS